MDVATIKRYLPFLLFIIVIPASFLIGFYSERDGRNQTCCYIFSAPLFAEPPEKINVVLLTYMRSGSTVTGEIFRNSPDVFYFYEPLRPLHEKLQVGKVKTYDTLERPDFIAESNKWLKDLFNCDFENNLFSTNKNTGSSSVHLSNVILRSTFSFSREQRFRSKEEESKKCRSARMRVIKTIRITNLQNIWEEIALENNTKIIHLLRDPRAVQYSRLRLKKSQLGPRLICDWPMQTIQFIQKMQSAARERYTEVIFENFAKNPVSEFRDIFKFLGTELSRSSEILIRNMTQSSNTQQGGYSTSNRNATVVAKSWERSLDEKNRKWIEDDPTCKKLIEHISRTQRG